MNSTRENPQELFLSAVSDGASDSPKILFLLDKKIDELQSSKNVQVIDYREKDLRMLTLQKEHWDGIWWDQASSHYRLEDNQRILGLLFQSLKPKSGVLALNFSEPAWTMNALDSQLKQAGLQMFRHLTQASHHFLLTRRV